MRIVMEGLWKRCAGVLLAVGLWSPLQAEVRPPMQIVSTDLVKLTNKGQVLEDIVRSSFEELGYTTSFVYQPATRGGFASERGEFDGELIRLEFYEQKVQNLIKVPAPLLKVNLVAVSLANEPVSVSLETLSQYRLTCPAGAFYSDLYCASSPFYIQAKTGEQMISLLRIGRSQLIVLPEVVAQTLVEQHADLTILKPPLLSINAFFFLHKRHAELVPRLAPRIAYYAKQYESYP